MYNKAQVRVVTDKQPKGRLKPLSDGLEEEIRFVWDGSHLLREIQLNSRYTSIGNNIVKEQIVQTISKKIVRLSE